jgi:hypothetical protein
MVLNAILREAFIQGVPGIFFDISTLPAHPPPPPSGALRNGVILQGLSGPLTAPWDAARQGKLFSSILPDWPRAFISGTGIVGTEA